MGKYERIEKELDYPDHWKEYFATLLNLLKDGVYDFDPLDVLWQDFSDSPELAYVVTSAIMEMSVRKYIKACYLYEVFFGDGYNHLYNSLPEQFTRKVLSELFDNKYTTVEKLVTFEELKSGESDADTVACCTAS